MFIVYFMQLYSPMVPKQGKQNKKKYIAQFEIVVGGEMRRVCEKNVISEKDQVVTQKLENSVVERSEI